MFNRYTQFFALVALCLVAASYAAPQPQQAEHAGLLDGLGLNPLISSLLALVRNLVAQLVKLLNGTVADLGKVLGAVGLTLNQLIRSLVNLPGTLLGSVEVVVDNTIEVLGKASNTLVEKAKNPEQSETALKNINNIIGTQIGAFQAFAENNKPETQDYVKGAQAKILENLQSVVNQLCQNKFFSDNIKSLVDGMLADVSENCSASESVCATYKANIEALKTSVECQ